MTRPTGFSVPGSGARMLILERDGKCGPGRGKPARGVLLWLFWE